METKLERIKGIRLANRNRAKVYGQQTALRVYYIRDKMSIRPIRKTILESNGLRTKLSKVPINELNIAIIAICVPIVRFIGCKIKFIENPTTAKSRITTTNIFN